VVNYYSYCLWTVVSEGRIDFATFVSILDKHSRLEKCQQDIVDAFKAHDRSGEGIVSASELRHILTQFGDKMSTAEGMYVHKYMFTYVLVFCSLTNLDFTEARDSDWQWHQLGRMQVCTLFQTDNHASIPSGIICYRFKKPERCSLLSVTLGISPLPAQDHPDVILLGLTLQFVIVHNGAWSSSFL